MGRGGGFSWPGDLLARLPKEVDPGAVFPMQALDANLVRWNSGHPDATVCGSHQGYGDPNLDVSLRPGVGLPPL